MYSIPSDGCTLDQTPYASDFVNCALKQKPYISRLMIQRVCIRKSIGHTKRIFSSFRGMCYILNQGFFFFLFLCVDKLYLFKALNPTEMKISWHNSPDICMTTVIT